MLEMKIAKSRKAAGQATINLSKIFKNLSKRKYTVIRQYRAHKAMTYDEGLVYDTEVVVIRSTRVWYDDDEYDEKTITAEYATQLQLSGEMDFIFDE